MECHYGVIVMSLCSALYLSQSYNYISFWKRFFNKKKLQQFEKRFKFLRHCVVFWTSVFIFCWCKSKKENPQKLTQLSSRSHPRHLVRKRTAQKDTIIDITSDSQVDSNFPNRWSPASLTFNNYFYLFLYLYIT